MKIYARTQAIVKEPLYTSLEKFKDMGFDGMEICFEHPEVMALMKKKKHMELASFLKNTGFSSFSCSYHQNMADDEKFDDTKAAMEFSAAMGAQDFIVASALGEPGDKDLWKLGLVRTKELLDAAKALGLRLLVEPEPVYVLYSTRDWLRLNDELDGSIYANIDLGHAFLTDTDPLGDIRKVGGRVAHCHIENMAAGVHSHLLPWEGDMDLAAYIEALRDIGFDGPLALDLYRSDYMSVAPECLEYIKKLIDNSSKHISN